MHKIDLHTWTLTRLERLCEALNKDKPDDIAAKIPYKIVERLVNDYLDYTEHTENLAPGMLPVELIDGKWYFRDDRLKQYRSYTESCDDPLEFMSFDEAAERYGIIQG